MVSTDLEPPILVLGGTGYIGRHIVDCLLTKEQDVRVLSRDATNARAILGEEVEIITGDVTRRQSIVDALQGVQRVIISLSAFSPRLIRWMWQIEHDAVLMVLEEASIAGVQRMVYLSGYDMREDLIEELNLEFGRIKLQVEAALVKTEFNWTILGLAPSMEMFFAMRRGKRMFFPGGGPPAFPTISPLDTGEITAQAVLRDDLAGKRFRLTGPEALSFPQAAQRISKATGEPLTFMKVPLMPLRIASVLLKPFYPYFYQVAGSARLLNRFPQDIAAQVPEDHQYLVDTFDYTPTTIEMEARRRMDN